MFKSLSRALASSAFVGSLMTKLRGVVDDGSPYVDDGYVDVDYFTS